MKVRRRKGVANRPGPEPCGGVREGAAEASAGEIAGQPLSRAIGIVGVPTPLSYAEGNTEGSVIRELSKDPTRSKTLCMRRSLTHRNWETSSEPTQEVGVVGAPEKADGRNAGVHADEELDACVVPMNGPNNGGASTAPPAEDPEGKVGSQEERWPIPRAPDTAPDQRVDGLGQRT